MSKSKAVSNNFNNLISKIEKQSIEYENTFDELNKFFRNLDRMRRSMEETIDRTSDLYTKNLELYKRFDAVEQYINLRLDGILEEVKKILDTIIIDDFNKKVEKVFNGFEERTERALGLIEGNEGIITSVEKIRSFAKEADMRLSKMDEKNIELDEKNIELDKKNANIDNKLSEIDDRITIIQNRNTEMNEIKNNVDKATNNLITKTSDIEDKVEKRVIKYLNEMHEKYDLVMQDLGYSLEERIKNSVIEIKEAQYSITQKMRTTDEKTDNFMKLANELFKHFKEIKSKSNVVSKNKIDEMQEKIDTIYNELNDKINELKNIVNG